jgi:hypothetical protein
MWPPRSLAALNNDCVLVFFLCTVDPISQMYPPRGLPFGGDLLLEFCLLGGICWRQGWQS